MDLAINKCRALANRSEVRDALDCIELERDVLSLAAAIVAACGKDPRFTPELMLEMIQRHINFSPDDLGFVFMNQAGQVIKDISGLDLTKVTRHDGIVRGGWPRTF